VGSKAVVAEVMAAVEAEITRQFERRLAALEAHITDLEERLNARGIFSGDCHVPGNPAHLWESADA